MSPKPGRLVRVFLTSFRAHEGVAAAGPGDGVECQLCRSPGVSDEEVACVVSFGAGNAPLCTAPATMPKSPIKCDFCSWEREPWCACIACNTCKTCVVGVGAEDSGAESMATACRSGSSTPAAAVGISEDSDIDTGAGAGVGMCNDDDDDAIPRILLWLSLIHI